MSHPHPRTERDLHHLGIMFSKQEIVQGIPERLECLAAWHRMSIEASKVWAGEPNVYKDAAEAYCSAIQRLDSVGVGSAESTDAMSPCLGPDL